MTPRRNRRVVRVEGAHESRSLLAGGLPLPLYCTRLPAARGRSQSLRRGQDKGWLAANGGAQQDELRHAKNEEHNGQNLNLAAPGNFFRNPGGGKDYQIGRASCR